MSKGKWLFHDKPAVVLAPNFDGAYERFGLSIKHDEPKAEGLLTLRFQIQLEDSGDLQTLTLVIRPEMITAISCDTRADYGDNDLHRRILSLIPDTSVRGMIDVLSIRVILRSPGRVICPAIPLPIHPRWPGEGRLGTFARLCQATDIRIHLGRNQVLPNQRARLDRFVLDLARANLRAPSIDLRRIKGGQGGREADWDAIHPPTIVAPPDYSKVPSNSRKRLRTASHSPVNETFSHQFVPCVGSPTEVNTPSTREDSPDKPEKIHSIGAGPDVRGSTPNPSTKDAGGKASGRKESTPLPEYEASFGACPTPSPASSKSRSSHGMQAFSDIKSTNFFSRPPPATAQSETALLLGSILQQLLPKAVEGAFQSVLGPLIDARIEDLVKRKLEILVQQHLPNLTSDALEQNMDGFLANVEDGNARAEVELAETVDVVKTELHETRDNAVKELESFVQQKIADFDADSEEITRHAVETLEDKTTELKGLIDVHWRRRLKRRRTTPGRRERRRSV